jgi:hypothetical protein
VKERWTVRWFRRRALLYHLLVVTIAPACLWAAWWQVHRAAAGNTLSYLYAVEWPVFAVMAVVGWWQLIHEDPAAVDTRGPFIPPPADADSGFYHPLAPAARPELPGPGGAPRSLGVYDASGGDLALIEPEAGELARIAADADAPDDAEEDLHALSSYNAYLARLSAGGGRKSWRNPHGVARPAPRPRPHDAGPFDDRR